MLGPRLACGTYCLRKNDLCQEDCDGVHDCPLFYFVEAFVTWLMSVNTKDRNAESRIKMNFKGPSGSDDIVARLVFHTNLHSLANVLNITDL